MSRSGGRRPVVALIGCGAIAEAFHLPALARHARRLSRLILVDPDTGRAEALRARFRGAEVRSDTTEVLGDIEGAIVATPPHLHHPIALECVKRGVHVLCEKPLAGTPEAARELAEAADAAGVSIAVNQTRRLFASHRRIRNLLAAGEIGRPRSLEYVLGEPFDWPAATASYFGAKSAGKGVLLDTGAHILDLVCWWLGGRPRLEDYRDDSFGGTEAVADIRLEHEGCRAHVRLSWLSKLENRYRIEAERGSIEGEAYQWSAFWLRKGSGRLRKIRTDSRKRTFADFANALVGNFLDVLDGRAAPMTSARDVLPSIDLIDECYRRRLRFDMPWHDAFQRLPAGVERTVSSAVKSPSTSAGGLS